ncbi:MAG: PID-CTERM protein-sorting domain-containing protein [Putridiphycobacter sp.]
MSYKVYTFINRVSLLLFFLALNVLALAQAGGPPGGPPPGGQVPTGTGPPCWDPECVPIDGGLGFLIAAGAVLGAKKIRDYKKQSDI